MRCRSQHLQLQDDLFPFGEMTILATAGVRDL